MCFIGSLSVMYESSSKRARLDDSDIHDDSCASEESWRGYETGNLYLSAYISLEDFH